MRERESKIILQRTAELAKIVANSFFKPFFQEVQTGSFEGLIRIREGERERVLSLYFLTFTSSDAAFTGFSDCIEELFWRLKSSLLPLHNQGKSGSGRGGKERAESKEFWERDDRLEESCMTF